MYVCMYVYIYIYTYILSLSLIVFLKKPQSKTNLVCCVDHRPKPQKKENKGRKMQFWFSSFNGYKRLSWFWFSRGEIRKTQETKGWDLFLVITFDKEIKRRSRCIRDWFWGVLLIERFLLLESS